MTTFQQQKQDAQLFHTTFGLVQADGYNDSEIRLNTPLQPLENGKLFLEGNGKFKHGKPSQTWRLRGQVSKSRRCPKIKVAALTPAQQEAANTALVSLWTDADGEYESTKAKALTPQAVRAALDAGADAEAKDKDGGTALMAAALEGHIDVACLLLSVGADTETKDESGATALVKAASLGCSKAARLLLGAGADKNAKDNTGWTALMSAATFDRFDVALLLLEVGVNAEAQDETGATALVKAAFWGNSRVASLLLGAVA